MPRSATYLAPLCDLQRVLHHRRVRLADPPQSQIHAWADLLELDARQPLPTALRHQSPDAHVHNRARRILGRREADELLQALDVDVRDFFAAEEIGKEALRELEFAGSFAARTLLEPRAREAQEGLQPRPDALTARCGKLGRGPGGILYHGAFEHIEHLVVKTPHEGQGMGALLAVAGEHKVGGIVFLRKKLEG